tara:strand:- start:217 stop:474 length:258 start_codon:yes stop_codon:yes gene_type:complete
MAKIDVTDIKVAINGLSYGDLKEVQDEILWARTKFFKVGTEVYFDKGGNGSRIMGKITKINPKTYSIKTNLGGWRVSKSLVQIKE